MEDRISQIENLGYDGEDPEIKVVQITFAF